MFLVLLTKVVQTCKQALFLVCEDDATPLACLKIGDSALQPLLYKGEFKKASSSLYPYLSSGRVRRKYSACRRGDSAYIVYWCSPLSFLCWKHPCYVRCVLCFIADVSRRCCTDCCTAVFEGASLPSSPSRQWARTPLFYLTRCP
jgi:hypothetical protein